MTYRYLEIIVRKYKDYFSIASDATTSTTVRVTEIDVVTTQRGDIKAAGKPKSGLSI